MFTAVKSLTPGAKVEIQDYVAPESDWYTLGTTPMEHVQDSKGIFPVEAFKAGR